MPYEPQHVRGNFQSGRMTTGYWRWTYSAGPGKLVRVTPLRFSSQHYLRILQDIPLPSVHLIYPVEEFEEIVVDQDSLLIHESRDVVQWFEDRSDVSVLN
ncbi:hypothetical protein Trydic_g6549 [Trypoxylus dichotomus]